MAEKMNKILHKRSVQPNELGNGPKLPDASILEYGEVAVNYGAGHEALSFKNNNDEVVSLRTDEYYQGKFNDVIGDIEATEARITDITTAIEENEEVLASAITDLDSRIKIIEENGSGGFDDENLGYQQSGFNYPVMKDDEDKLYVTVEWTDENTTYAPVTSTEDGLMSSTDKSKLDSITVENGKVINVDALTDDNLGYETANGNYGIQKDDNGLLYVSVNTEQFETLSNKSETLSEESTHNQYPTSKAVYDVIVSNERVTAAGLSNIDERIKTIEKQMVENAVDEEAVKEIITEVLSDFDETVSGNSTFVTVSVSQTDGRISNVTVSDSGIASTTITDALDRRLDVIEGTGEGSIKKAVADEATLRSQADEALDAKITILNGDANTTGSVKNTVTTEITKVVANAPEDLDTLKEIADYIASDKTHAAEINTDISNLKSTLTGFDKDNTVGKKFEAIESSIKDVRDIFGEGFSNGNTVEKVITDNERVTAAGLSNIDERVKTLEKQMVENAVNEEAVIEIFNRELADFDETASGNSTFVTVSVSQTDGRISNVTVSDSGIASTTITDALDGRLDVIEGEGDGSIKKAVADEAALRSQADEALDAKITILNADASTSGSVKNTVTTEIAKIVADAPEDLNTLKEIADYIASDKTHAAEINTDISNLKSTLTGFDKDNTVGKKFEAIESSIKDVRDILGGSFSSGITVEKVITDNERVTAAALSSVDNRLKFIETNEIGFLGNNNLGYTGDPDTYAVEKDANNKLFVTVNTEHLEQTSNKSNVLDANSTEYQYPSSKAVYNYINTIEEGTSASLNALDGRLDVIEGTGEGSIKKAVADEAALRSQADEALDAKIINLSAHVDEIDEGAAASLNTLNNYIKILENRIASLEAKLAAITIEE